MHNPDASALHRRHLGPVSHHCRNRLEDNTLGGLKGATANRTPPDPAGLASLPASPSRGGDEPMQDVVGSQFNRAAIIRVAGTLRR